MTSAAHWMIWARRASSMNVRSGPSSFGGMLVSYCRPYSRFFGHAAYGTEALMGAGGTEPTLANFGLQPWWIVIIKSVAILLFLLLGKMLTIWAERRLIGRMQNLPGPNRAGPFGLLQGVADALKLTLKEDIVPRGADKVLFWLAPVVSATPALVGFAVTPFGPVVSVAGVRTPL